MEKRKRCLKSEIPGRIKYASAHTIWEFAKKYGITYSGAEIFCRKHCVKPKPERNGLSRYSIKEILKYCDGSKTVAEIARKFKCPRQSIYDYLKSHNIPYKHIYISGRKNGERDEMIRYLAQKYSYSAIGRALGYSVWTIHEICKEKLT